MAGLDFARPTDEIRDAKAALIQVALAAAKLDAGSRIDVRPKKTARMLATAETVLPAVVAGEKNDRVVLEFQLA